MDVGDNAVKINGHVVGKGSFSVGDRATSLSYKGKRYLFNGNASVGDRVKVLNYKGQRYIIGGGCCLECDGTWQKFADVPDLCYNPVGYPELYRRYGTAFIKFKGKLWIVYGQDGYDNDYRDSWYSTDGKVWTLKASGLPDLSTPWGSTIVSRVEYNDKVWVSTNGSCYYSSDMVSWSLWPAGGRRLCGVTSFGKKLWYLGGYATPSSYYNDIYYSDNDAASWTKLVENAAWSGRYMMNLCPHNGKMFLSGGYSSSGYQKDVWYSADMENWVQVTDLPSASLHEMVSFNGLLWAIGSGGIYTSDDNGATWDTPSTTFTPGNWGNAFATKDAIYYFGGLNGDSKTSVWYYC